MGDARFINVRPLLWISKLVECLLLNGRSVLETARGTYRPIV